MVCFSGFCVFVNNTGIDITFCRYFNSIISYIKRANIKSYIAVIFGQVNINITSGCVAAAIRTCFTAYAVCSKRNAAAIAGRAIITCST